MNEQERNEALLWSAARPIDDDLTVDASGDAAVDREELLAYREGRLPVDRRNALERRLLGSAALRGRLAASAGIGIEPPAAVRERVLEHFDRERGRPAATEGATPAEGGRLLNFRPRLRGVVGALVAASLFVVAGLLLVTGERSLPADLRYELRASGLREERGPGDSQEAEILRALPTTRIELELIPDRSIAGVELAIYRQRPGSPAERVEVAPEWLEVRDGLIRIEAKACDLLGTSPGRGQLLLALGLGGRDWPATIPTGQDPAAVLRAEADRLFLQPFEVVLWVDTLPSYP